MTDFEEQFKQRALADFHLDALVAKSEYTVASIRKRIDDIVQCAIDEDKIAIGVRRLLCFQEEISSMLEKPDSMTNHELSVLGAMRLYLRRNTGSQQGFAKYRREATEVEMERFCELVVAAKAALLAHRDELDDAFNKAFNTLRQKDDANRLMREARHNKQKARWAREKVTCGCGGHFTRGNKAVHVSGKKHTKWAKMQE